MMEAKKASLVMTVLVVLSVFYAVIAILPECVSAATRYVGGSGPGNYTTIQGAIDAANSGDTIYVYNGTYYERISVSKTLSLIGEDRDATIIDAQATGDAVLVVADWVNITGFTVANSGQDLVDAGIKLKFSQNCSVTNNNVANNHDGIILYLSNDNVIANNTLYSNTGNGIFIWYSSGNTLTKNKMTKGGVYVWGFLLEHWNTHTIDTLNTVNGKPVYYWRDSIGGVVPSGAGQVILANCMDVMIVNQNVSNGTAGIQVGFSSYIAITGNNIFLNNYEGIFLSYSTNTIILRNGVLQNHGTGIRLMYSSNNTITHNNASWNNGYGIGLYHSSNNTITHNNASWNSYPGAYLDSSDYNWIHHNNFLNNTVQAFDNRDTNHWDNGYPSGGNYWSDYTGIDGKSGPNQDQPGSDGIGDTPYVIDADSQDWYPLMSPCEIFHLLPPIVVEATLSGKNSENITITWLLSLDDGMGFNTVVGYEIYRNSTFDPRGKGYQPIALVPNGTSEFIDSSAGEGDPNNYFYRVCAINGTGNTSCSSDQAGKFTRPLSKGPNLISIPLIQSDESLPTALQTVSFDNVWSYDTLNQEWKSLMKSKPYGGTLQYVNHTMALWVNVTQSSNLTVAGVIPTSTTIKLHAGWNLVGFPSFNGSYAVSDLKAAVGVERMEGFEALTPPYFLRALADGEILQTGFGYWIRTFTDGLLTVINS